MPKEYSRHLERLREKFKLPVAFVIESLPLVRRNALVKMQVPFVVSGAQLFLPPPGVFGGEECCPGEEGDEIFAAYAVAGA